MEKEIFENLQEEKYEKQMGYYSITSAKNQKKYKPFYKALIIVPLLTPATAVLNCLDFSFANELMVINSSAIAVVVSGMVELLTNRLKIFNYQELWVTYRSTYKKLNPGIQMALLKSIR